jgi:hypothetical protein
LDEVWTNQFGTTGAESVNGGIVSGDKTEIYIAAATNINWPDGGATLSGGTEALLVKLTPGDFDADGYVNSDDLNQLGLDALDGTGTNTIPGDFTGNNLIEHDDVLYMITDVFDAKGYGDANINGAYDVGDIDLVNKAAYANSQGSGAYSALNDMDKSGGNINTADRDAWLAAAATDAGFASPFHIGDANLDGDVDVFQFDGGGDAQALSSNLGQTSGQTWADGDFNGDGDVDAFQFDGGGDAQLLSSNIGISSAASEIAMSGVENAAPGSAAAIYNDSTGELIFDVGSGIGVVGLQAIGNVLVGNIDNGSIFGAPVQLDANTIAFFNAGGLPVGEDSLGLVLTAGLTQGDLGFSYTPVGGTTTVVDVTIVPEPTSLALLGFGGLFMIRRRRAA